LRHKKYIFSFVFVFVFGISSSILALLIFLKYISDAFEELYATLKADEGEYAGADPEDKDEYKAENVFFVPQDARCTQLVVESNTSVP
jgi:type I restriction enzyme M protein